jgi:hypothetical protein
MGREPVGDVPADRADDAVASAGDRRRRARRRRRRTRDRGTWARCRPASSRRCGRRRGSPAHSRSARPTQRIARRVRLVVERQLVGGFCHISTLRRAQGQARRYTAASERTQSSTALAPQPQHGVARGDPCFHPPAHARIARPGPAEDVVLRLPLQPRAHPRGCRARALRAGCRGGGSAEAPATSRRDAGGRPTPRRRPRRGAGLHQTAQPRVPVAVRDPPSGCAARNARTRPCASSRSRRSTPHPRTPRPVRAGRYASAPRRPPPAATCPSPRSRRCGCGRVAWSGRSRPCTLSHSVIL